MDGGEKLFAVFMLCVTFAVSLLIGWGVVGTVNTHNYEKTCLASGKTIQFRTLEGQDYAYKECK